MSEQAGASKLWSTYKNTPRYRLCIFHSTRAPFVSPSFHPFTMSPPDDEPQGRHRRFSCDELLVAVSTSDGPDPDSELADPDGLLGSDAINTAGGRSESPPVHTNHDIPRRQQRRAFFIRTLALLCVCSLSIGSH